MKRNSSRTNPKRSLGGFTLVELIVVIAVLAILAGVGAVAYTGYIEYTKKGLDKQTVGEIIHAIELANYDDPSLFETGATVYITKDGVKSGNAAIDAALERALGDLSTVKLTSENWKLADISKFSDLKNLGTEGSKLDDYYDAMESTGKKAVFADDVGGLWDAVVENKEKFGGSRDDYLQLAIKYLESNVDSEGNPTGGIAQWNSGDHMELGAEKAQAIALARNYCFAAYAAKQNLSADMKEELQKFIDDGYGKYGTAQPTNGSGFFWEYFEEHERDWETIVANYNSDQASIDSKAYMAMMEAVEAVGGADKKDDELMETMEQYVGVVAAGIGSRDALTYALNIDGEYATINVTKQAERVVVNPGDLDPRTGSGNDAPQEEVVYTANNSTVACQSAGGDTNWKCTVIMHANEKITVTIKEIPGLGIETTSPTGGVTCGLSGTKVTIVSGTSGGTILISWDPSSLGPEFEGMDGSVTIEVVVK